MIFLVELFDLSGFRGADKCYNRTLCEEHLNVILPAKPPFHPRQFHKCAVVGNSGDLLKTEFGEEIDSHDAVFRDNEAPVNEVIICLKILICDFFEFTDCRFDMVLILEL